MKQINTQSISLSKFCSSFILASLFLCIFFYSCTNLLEKESTSYAQSKNHGEDFKQKGTHVFGRIDSTNIQAYKENNIEWLALVPWGFQDDYQSAQVNYHHRRRNDIKKRDSSWISRINLAQDSGYKVFLKPHIWIQDNTSGMWRSDIAHPNAEDWEVWKNSYQEFILHYAKLAEKAEAELFCIGIEFTQLSLNYPDFWRSLIKEIRTVYSGEITYAANWYEEYDKISFWDELDYIGIQAYFPLTENDSPSVNQISKGWKKHISKIEAVSKKYKKKVLFTELGYKSTKDSAKEPWKWVDYSEDSKLTLCHKTQANCYQAFFDSVWHKEWMAGLFIWQMRGDHSPERAQKSTDFTPQFKPAEKIIKQGYSSL